MSYSQYNEEFFILKGLGETKGLFLDIGAYDGVTFSNTKILVERGWKGVMVEPSAWMFTALSDNYKEELGVELVQALVGTSPGLVSFWPSKDAVSTTEEWFYQKWKGQADYKRSCWVPQVTIAQLIARFPGLQNAEMVNIDTEGTASDLFLNYPFLLNRPKVFCIEHFNKPTEVKRFAIDQGYGILYENETNVVLGR